MTYRYFFNVTFKENLLKRWLCSTLVFAHTVIVFVYILSLFIFNKTVKKKVIGSEVARRIVFDVHTSEVS
jgi:hypothetical protein